MNGRNGKTVHAMTPHQLHELLSDLEDTHEIVIRRTVAESGLLAAWADAQEESREAFAWWATTGGAGAYAVYRAAEDRSDAALAALAFER